MREDKAQTKLRQVVTKMEGIRDLLRRIYEAVPVSPREEVMLLGEAEPDIATEVRSVIECVLADRIEPAIQILTEAADYRPKGPSPPGPLSHPHSHPPGRGGKGQVNG